MAPDTVRHAATCLSTMHCNQLAFALFLLARQTPGLSASMNEYAAVKFSPHCYMYAISLPLQKESSDEELMMDLTRYEKPKSWTLVTVCKRLHFGYMNTNESNSSEWNKVYIKKSVQYDRPAIYPHIIIVCTPNVTVSCIQTLPHLVHWFIGLVSVCICLDYQQPPTSSFVLGVSSRCPVCAWVCSLSPLCLRKSSCE